MKSLRTIYTMLMAGATAHARWDYEASMNILKSRKKLLILGLLALPCIIFSVAYAADVLPAVLGGKKAYSPGLLHA